VYQQANDCRYIFKNQMNKMLIKMAMNDFIHSSEKDFI